MKATANWLVRIYFTLVAMTLAGCVWLAYDSGFRDFHSMLEILWDIGFAIVVIVAAALLPLLVVAVWLDRSFRNARDRPLVSHSNQHTTVETTK